MIYAQNNNPKRQKLISFDYDEIAAKTTIDTVDELKMNLQAAIEIELSTIPPYLCALYSIKDGTNIFPAFIIRSVVVEEMLHMIMAANILNALGGEPQINIEKSIPSYPGPLKHSAHKVMLNLYPFSKKAVKGFLAIEKPAKNAAPPTKGTFNSIGQFYEAISGALIALDQKSAGSIFIGDPARQVTPDHYYGAGGKLVSVTCLTEALQAIEEIVGQGEGIDHEVVDGDPGAFGQGKEVAHYFRFNEIFKEKYYREGDTSKSGPTGDVLPVDWDAVYPMRPNPKMNDYKSNPELHEKAWQFNKTYMTLLNNLQLGCNGNPDILKDGIPLMYKLKEQATDLMKIRVGENEFAGPTFEYIHT